MQDKELAAQRAAEQLLAEEEATSKAALAKTANKQAKQTASSQSQVEGQQQHSWSAAKTAGADSSEKVKFAQQQQQQPKLQPREQRSYARRLPSNSRHSKNSRLTLSSRISITTSRHSMASTLSMMSRLDRYKKHSRQSAHSRHSRFIMTSRHGMAIRMRSPAKLRMLQLPQLHPMRWLQVLNCARRSKSRQHLLHHCHQEQYQVPNWHSMNSRCKTPILGLFRASHISSKAQTRHCYILFRL